MTVCVWGGGGCSVGVGGGGVCSGGGGGGGCPCVEAVGVRGHKHPPCTGPVTVRTGREEERRPGITSTLLIHGLYWINQGYELRSSSDIPGYQIP